VSPTVYPQRSWWAVGWKDAKICYLVVILNHISTLACIILPQGTPRRHKAHQENSLLFESTGTKLMPCSLFIKHRIPKHTITYWQI